MITSTWNSFILVDSNGMIRFKKKLQLLKKEIRKWVAEYKNIQSNSIRDVKNKLSDIDKLLDPRRAKVRWAIEGDENSKFFHGIINRKRANLSVKGIMIEGEWVDDPIRVKDEFYGGPIPRQSKSGIGNGIHTHEERYLEGSLIVDCTLSGLFFRRLFALDTVWLVDLNGYGVFRGKDVMELLDEFFLPRADVPTRSQIYTIVLVICAKSDKVPVVVAVVSEKSAIDEKDNPKVTSKVSKGKSLDVFKYKRKTELPKDK
ncbi:hypothetical protein Tco_0844802 [Tanacetum coccineum]